MRLSPLLRATMIGAAVISPATAFSADDLRPSIIDDSLAGAYVVARIAGAFGANSNFDVAFDDFTTGVRTEFEDRSYMYAGAIGYRFDDTFSLELEGGSTAMGVDAHTLLEVPTATDPVPLRFDEPDAFGSANITYAMVNMVAEQDFGSFIRPYVSAGIGVAEVDISRFGVNLPAPVDPLPNGPVSVIDDTDYAYAWQIGAGLIADITEALSLEFGYRYFRVQNIGVVTTTDNETELTLSQHQILSGVRINF